MHLFTHFVDLRRVGGLEGNKSSYLKDVVDRAKCIGYAVLVGIVVPLVVHDKLVLKQALRQCQLGEEAAAAAARD